MPPLTVTTKYQLKAWLDENRWFEVGNVLDLSPPPAPLDKALNSAQDTVSFRLENCIRGGMNAGDVLEFNSYQISASGVTTWSCSDGRYIAYLVHGYADENEIELDEESDRLRLIIDGDLTLECSQMLISEPTRQTRVVRPSLSACECLIEVYRSPLPSARDWIDWFAAAGLDVVFRIYSDQARSPDEVPADYSGWFLQVPSCVSDAQGGLMIFGIKETGTGFSVKFDFWNSLDEREAPLWTTLAKVFATEFPTSQVSCGNCHLTPEQWLIALEQGQPYLNSLFVKE